MKGRVVLFSILIVIAFTVGTVLVGGELRQESFSFRAKVLELKIQPVSTNYDQLTFKVEQDGEVKTLSWRITRLDANFAFDEETEITWRPQGNVTIYSLKDNRSPLYHPFFLEEPRVIDNPSVFASTDIIWIRYRWERDGKLYNFISIARSLSVEAESGQPVVMERSSSGHFTILPAN